jgi:hypothetical protein
MATHGDVDRFLFQLHQLMIKHDVAVGVIMFHPPGTTGDTMSIGMFGSPSLEWCAGAGEEYVKQLDLAIREGRITSKRQIEPNFGVANGRN